jgi:hypothetical protein
MLLFDYFHPLSHCPRRREDFHHLLPEEIPSEITVLLLLAPQEKREGHRQF